MTGALPAPGSPLRGPNPFYNEYHWTPYNIWKAVICGCVLLPLRLCILAFAIVLAFTFGLLASLFCETPRPGPERPHPPIVHLFFLPIRLALRLALFSFGYHWISVTDERRPPARSAPIIVANHISMMDILFMGYYFSPSVVGKSSLARVPVISLLGRLAQTIFVTRDDVDSRAAACTAILTRVTSPGFRPLLIFPEGTCTNGARLITFKQGAFRPGVPVLPVLLRYPHHHLNPANCWGPLARHPFLLMLQFTNHLEVTILEVYTPSEPERADPDLFARNVRELYKALLGVPATGSPVEDVRFSALARKDVLPTDFADND